MFVPMVEPATSDWQELTAEILWKLVDVLQPQGTTVSAFAPEQYLSVFKRVCFQWRQAARKGLAPGAIAVCCTRVCCDIDRSCRSWPTAPYPPNILQ